MRSVVSQAKWGTWVRTCFQVAPAPGIISEQDELPLDETVIMSATWCHMDEGLWLKGMYRK